MVLCSTDSLKLAELYKTAHQFDITQNIRLSQQSIDTDSFRQIEFTNNNEKDFCMATTAYILIETAAGKAGEVSDALIALDEVINVDAVIGPYDIIAVTNTEGQNTVGDLVISKVHVIPGIVRTVTCLAVTPSSK